MSVAVVSAVPVVCHSWQAAVVRVLCMETLQQAHRLHCRRPAVTSKHYIQHMYQLMQSVPADASCAIVTGAYTTAPCSAVYVGSLYRMDSKL